MQPSAHPAVQQLVSQHSVMVASSPSVVGGRSSRVLCSGPERLMRLICHVSVGRDSPAVRGQLVSTVLRLISRLRGPGTKTIALVTYRCA